MVEDMLRKIKYLDIDEIILLLEEIIVVLDARYISQRERKKLLSLANKLRNMLR